MNPVGTSPRTERRKHRRGIRQIAIIGIISAVISVGIVMAIGFASFREFAAGNRMREDVLYSSAIRAGLQHIYEDLLAAESGTLGYVVTGREDFLTPLRETRAVIGEQVAALARQSADRPQHATAFTELTRLAEEEMRLLSQMVEIRNAAGGLSAASMLQVRRGKSVMDEIRGLVNTVSDAELAAMTRRTQEVRIASQRTKRTLLLLLGAAILVVGGSSLIMLMHLVGRRRAESALADTLSRHRAILASAMDAIITIDPTGLIETINPATERLFGARADELVGRPIEHLFDVKPQPGDGQVLKALEEIAARGGHAREFTARRLDGSTLAVDVAVGRMRASDGSRLVAILHDVTERKRAEIIKNEFVSTVSHELRTPLTSIAGSLGLLEGGAAGEIPGPAKRLVTIANQNSRRLVRLINDILDIEKMQSARITFAREPVSIPAVAELAMEQNASFADQHNVRLKLKVEAADASVVGDQDRLIQVLTNLISNAVKFSPKDGVVTLTVGRHGDMVRISVEDHGAGIPLAFRPSMFTRFAQADNSDTRQRGGTGLGLAIVKEIVQRHAGQVSFETEEGVGTTFHVDLPARLPHKTAAKPAEPSAVLLVDSDGPRAAAGSAELAGLGYKVERAETAAEAEGRAAIRPYRAILIAPMLRDREAVGLIRALSRVDRAGVTPLLVAAPPAQGGGLQAVRIFDWLDTPISRERIGQVLGRLGLSGRASLLHVCPGEEARRAFAEAARPLADVVAVASFDEAMAARAMRDFALIVLDLSRPGPLPAELMGALLARAPGGAPLAILAPPKSNPAMTRCLKDLLEAGDLPAAADTLAALEAPPHRSQPAPLERRSSGEIPAAPAGAADASS